MPSELQQTACYKWLCNQQSNDNVLFSVRKATENPNFAWAKEQGSSVIQGVWDTFLISLFVLTAEWSSGIS